MAGMLPAAIHSTVSICDTSQRQTNMQTERQTGRKVGRPKDGQTGRPTGRLTGRLKPLRPFDYLTIQHLTILYSI